MATERIQIVVSSAGAKAVRNDIEGLAKGADKAGKSLFSMAGAIKALVVGAAVRETIKLADSYTNMSNRIRTVTKSTGEFSAVQEEVARIAQRTRSPIDAVTEGYTRLRVSTDRMGLSQRETLQFTESLNQAIAIGGSTAQESAGALRQLGQGLGTGALRADEFNSVMENAPIVMEYIAKEMKVTQGELKVLGGQGKITGEVIVSAFRNAREELAERFAKSVPTVDQAVTTLMNSVTQLVGSLDGATNSTSTLAGAIIDLSKWLDESKTEVSALATELTSLSEFKGVFDGIFPSSEDDNSISALQFMALMVSTLEDRALGAAKAFAILARTAGVGGPIQMGDTMDGLLEHLKMVATGQGPATARVLDTIKDFRGGRRGTTTVNDEEGDPHNVLDRAGKGGPGAAAANSKKVVTFAQVLRDLQRESELLRMHTQEREIQAGLDQAKQRITASLVGNQEKELRLQLEQNQALQRANDISLEMGDRISKAMNDARDARSEAMRQISSDLGDRESAGRNKAASEGLLGNAPDRGFTTTRDAMGEEQLRTMRTFGETMADIFGPGGTMQQGMRGIIDNMSSLIGHSIAFGASWKETEQAVKALGQSILAEVIGSLIRIPIQLAINEAIASGLRAKATAETVAQATATTAAMAPAAAATSLATAGGNSVGATAAIVGVSALAAGALIGAALFKDGGYTGDGSRDGVAGLVHGREFVVNAEATARHRGQLEAMNAGRSSAGGGGVHVTIVNNAGGVEFETRQVDDKHIEIIARRIVQETAPDVIASDLRSPQSKTGRAISQTTTASRRRA